MSSPEAVLSEEQLDYLTEMMNVGIGNAAAALEQLLQCPVEVKIPDVHVLASSELSAFFKVPTMAVACAKMRIIGDVRGELFFVVPDEERPQLIELAERAILEQEKTGWGDARKEEWDASVLMEIANISAGAYLLSIYKFSKLNLFHTVPDLAIDMIQSILDESLARRISEDPVIILIENNFILGQQQLPVFFLFLIPTVESMKRLIDSMDAARSM